MFLRKKKQKYGVVNLMGNLIAIPAGIALYLIDKAFSAVDIV